jgi:hypothetical protein
MKGGWGGIDWIDPAQDRERWRVVGRFHKMRQISWLAEDLLASDKEICSTEWLSYGVSELRSLMSKMTREGSLIQNTLTNTCR